MDDFHENREVEPNGGGGLACGLPARMLELLGCLFADVSSDVEVVTREPGLRDEMRERLRRALDRVGCALEVLEAMREAELGQSEPVVPSGPSESSEQLPWSGQPKRSGQLEQSARVTEEVSAKGGCRGGCGDTGCSDDYRGDDASDVMERVRCAVELLARSWPQDYPLGAVEWLFTMPADSEERGGLLLLSESSRQSF